MRQHRFAGPTSLLTVMLLLAATAPSAAAAHEDMERRFVAHLDGSEIVPPVDTPASGQATFTLNEEGTELRFRLEVEDIENVVQAHIHFTERGENGPIVVFLFGLVPPGGGPVDGVLSEGVITGADFVGPLAGSTMDTLIEKMATGGAAVIVHTNDGVPPANTGPGDLPPGEIRGQIVEVQEFAAVLVGTEEVPPRETPASGDAHFELNDDATELRFRLGIRNIENLFAAHIHVGPRGENGPIVAFLFESETPIDVDEDRDLAEGVITEDDLIGPLEGEPLSALLIAMATGGAYVNAHTNDLVPPENTDAGDFPGGEVRGQIAPVRDLQACADDVELTALRNGSVRVDWDATEDALGYNVLRRDADNGGGFERIATLGPNATSFTDTGTTPGKTFDYRVQVLDGTEKRDCDETASVTAIPTFPTLLAGLLASASVLLGYVGLRRR